MAASEIMAHRQSMVASAEALVRSGILSASQHGNMSVLLPGESELLLTAGSGLGSLRTDELARLDRGGRVVEGRLAPTAHEIINMHTVVYEHLPHVRAVVHTHQPYASAFAVASRPIECVAEVMARWMGAEPVPVAKYGPRGSDVAVENIAAVLREHPSCKALLLEHHGVLVFGEDAEQTARIAIALEEAAQLALLASTLGPLRPLPVDAAASSQQRRVEFERIGGVGAGSGPAGA
jgi:L-ribulose-5-phosphate 4-epimerase